MSTVRRWDALTREEIAELAPDALLVLPVGTTEQHGPHLATCTDALIAGTVAERAAAAATRPKDDPARADARPMAPPTTTCPSAARCLSG